MTLKKQTKKQNKSAKKEGLPVDLAYHSHLSYAFLFIIMTILFVAVLWIFRPFLLDIVLAGVLASFTYPLYKFILKFFKSKSLSGFVTVVLVAAIIIVPLINFFIYLTQQSLEAYNQFRPIIEDENFLANIAKYISNALGFLHISVDQVSSSLLNFTSKFNNVLLSLSTGLLKETTNFLVSFLIIFLTMYYFFVDGKELMRRVMNLTPLPNKYDVQLFSTFREVSYSAIVSTFVVAVFQGIVGGFGFWLAGLPAFFPAILIAVFSILPYVGAFVIWMPAVIYLISLGRFTDAIILTIVGVVISFGDNILRAYLIKGKAQIHEMIVFFSIIGGVVVFGFWGVVLGPLIVSLLFTVIQIYEQEFGKELEKTDD